MPGKYNVSIVKKSLCWQLESVVVETSILEDPEVPKIVFTQSGFRLSCDISHDTELNFEMEKDEKIDSEVLGRLRGVPLSLIIFLIIRSLLVKFNPLDIYNHLGRIRIR